MANVAPIRLTSPRGRLVQGSPFKGQTTNQQGEPLVVKSGPNKGQPRTEYFVAVAFQKSHPETMPYLETIVRHAAGCYPQFFPQGVNMSAANFGCINPSFSFKIIDGDGYDDKGKPNGEKAGFAGCWVVRYSSGFAPGIWQEPNFGELDRVTDERMLPRGHFCRVNHTVDDNKSDQTAGVYINLDKIAISADQHGAEIIQSGPTAAEAFGGSTPAPAPAAAASLQPAPVAAASLQPAPVAAASLQPVPGAAYTIEALRGAGWTDEQIVAGGYATRSAPAPAPLPVPASSAPPAPTPAASTPAVPAMPSPSSPAPVPYTGYMPGAAPAPTPAAPQRQMTAAANGATYEAMIAAGWTDAMLVQHGMMVG